MFIVDSVSKGISFAAFLFVMLSLRYLLFAGVAYWHFWQRRKDEWQNRRVQKRFPKKGKISSEIKWSFISFAFFALMSVFVGISNAQGWTLAYFEIADRGLPYFVLSIFLLMIVHDTYFYWMHRFMHWKPLYKHIHKVHHESTNPSPFASFSFHPLEALLEAGIAPLFVFLIPVHPAALGIFFVYSHLMNVMGHLGYEIFPSGFTRGFFWWQNTSTHHNMHHSKFNCNYGLYFNWWDRIMGTNHPEYHETFEKVVSHKKTRSVNVNEGLKPLATNGAP